MHPRTVGRPPRRTPVMSQFSVSQKRPTTTASRARLHPHRAAGRHRDHRDLDRSALPRFQSSSKPSQTSASEKRSHPNRQRGERVLYGVWQVSVSGTTSRLRPTGQEELQTTNETLFNELRGCTAATGSCPAAATLNTRQIVFISPPDVKNSASPRSGIGTATGVAVTEGNISIRGAHNYVVRIDGDYNNQVANPYTANAGAEPHLQPWE